MCPMWAARTRHWNVLSVLEIGCQLALGAAGLLQGAPAKPTDPDNGIRLCAYFLIQLGDHPYSCPCSCIHRPSPVVLARAKGADVAIGSFPVVTAASAHHWPSTSVAHSFPQAPAAEACHSMLQSINQSVSQSVWGPCRRGL